MDNKFSFVDKQLENTRKVLAYLQDNTNTMFPNNDESYCAVDGDLENDELFLYHIKEVTYAEKAPRREAVENILGIFRGKRGLNFVYILLGSKNRVDFYFGVAFDKTSDCPNTVNAFAQYVLLPNIKGNFRGCEVDVVGAKDRLEILKKLKTAKKCGTLEGVPGLYTDGNGNEPEDSFQGVDRLIDVMQGHNFGLAVIAKPYSDTEMKELQNNLFSVYDALLPLTKYSLQYSFTHIENESDSNNISFSRQASKSTQKNVGRNFMVSHGDSEDVRDDKNNQLVASESNNDSTQTDKARNYSETISDSDRTDSKAANISGSHNESFSHSFNTSYTNTYTTSTSNNKTVNYQRNCNEDKSKSANESYQKNKSKNSETSESHNDGFIQQMDVESKAASSWIEYLDKIVLPRVEKGLGKGLFLTSTYLFSDTPIEIECLAQTAQSIYSGTRGNKAALKYVPLNTNSKVLHALQRLQNPILVGFDGSFCDAALSRKSTKDSLYRGCWLSTEELGILAGLPQKDVVGLSLREEVEYGLNVATDADSDDSSRFVLGTLIKGGTDTDIPVYLDKSKLNKHIFVAGVTGSGKTVTCQNILLKSDLPFMVIEPAKTEYRALKKELCKDLLIFTPGNQQLGTFFLNPFELFPGEAISSRVDMLKATIEASMHMEAAIPQILEEAMYKAYIDRGWSIRNNKWYGKDDKSPNGPFSNGTFAFPTLSDFKNAVEDVVKSKNFDARLRDEYLGTIRSLLAGLMVGAKGLMLNVERSVDFKDLVKRKVVIELEEIKSGKEKSLLMGFILTNLIQAVKYSYKQSIKSQKSNQKYKAFQHITLVEEAHRLLSRYVQGDSQNKKQGVETFADMLAEVRKYGESLIIADQIPEKMTPEVLKNTNTKIVHRLFAKDDKDAIGNTIALEDEQKTFLSNLKTGRAIVFTEGWSKAAQLRINMQYKTDDLVELDENIITEAIYQYYAKPEVARNGILPGLEQVSDVGPKDVKAYLQCLWDDQSFEILEAFFKNGIKYSSSKKEDWELLASCVGDTVQNAGFDFYVSYMWARLGKVQDKFAEKGFVKLLELLKNNRYMDAKNYFMSVD